MYYRKIDNSDRIEFSINLDERHFEEKVAIIYGASCQTGTNQGGDVSASADSNVSDDKYISGIIRCGDYHGARAVVDWLNNRVTDGELTRSALAIVGRIDPGRDMGGELISHLYQGGPKPNWLS